MPIPMEQWGQDHWGTLAYIETRIVDHGGVPDPCHMRCDRRLHPALAHDGSRGKPTGTRLSNGSIRGRHDDWNCLDDAAAAGLLLFVGDPIRAIYRFTDRGWKFASALRRHKAEGGSFATFDYRTVERQP